MRGKKAALNTIFSLVQEFVSVICAFILPRLILTAFGSKYNGLFNSISQFLGCAYLLRAGVGGVTRAALYKPLENKNQDDINSIVKATDLYMKKIGLIFAGFIVITAIFYSFFLTNEFEWFFTFSLFLIIGASKFAESFFGITYVMVLQADQRLWIQSIIYSISLIINTIIGAVLIHLGATVHIVKLGSAFVFVLYPLVLRAYVIHYYNIDTHVKPDNHAISQRWDAFWHQVSYFVMENTDIMILTFFTNMLEVSVYSVYNLIFAGMIKLIVAFSSGLEAAFGNMIARDEINLLDENLRIIENMMFSLTTVIYTCTALLIFDFVSIYTRNVTDVNYIRFGFAYVMIIAHFFNAIRLPYQMVVQAAGHYKQTKKGAIIEPLLNILLSILFVIKYGLVGVAVGTLAATIFRTVQFSVYMCKHIIPRNPLITLERILLSVIESAAIILCIKSFHLPVAEGYDVWVLKAFLTGIVSLFIVIAGNFFAFKRDMLGTIRKIRNLWRKTI